MKNEIHLYEKNPAEILPL